MSSRRLDQATIALFLAGLCAPAFDQLVRPDQARDTLEGGRVPAPAAGLPRSAAELASFPRRFEAHYDDTFGLRDVLLEGNALEQWFVLRRSPSPFIEPTAEGWCFMGGQSRAVHRGLLPLREDELEAWVHGLLARRDFLAARGIGYLFVLCPNKETVYPERVLDSWNPVGPTRLEQLAARMAREPDSPFFDLRPALAEAKAGDGPEDWLYTRLGSHWNGRGSHAAYQAILTRLQRDFPALEPIPIASCRAVKASGSTDTLAHLLYLGRWIQQPPRYVLELPERGYEVTVPSGRRPVTRKAIEAPRLLWLHDSFGPYLEALVCESFSSVQAHWTYDFPAEALFEARPDVVLETFTERLLIEGEPYSPLDTAAESPQAVFERAGAVLWRADAEFTGVQPQGETLLERHAGTLRVKQEGAWSGMLLPALELTSGSQALLRIEADCAEVLVVEAFVRRAGGRLFGRKHQTRSELGPETRVAVLRLPVVVERFETLVRFLPEEASLDVRSLEIRLAPRESQ